MLGRSVWLRTLAQPRQPEAEDNAEPDAESTSLSEHWERLAKQHARFERWFDPVETLSFLLGEQRRVDLERLVAHLEYSFADVATTGKLMGAVYALSALIPPPAQLTQQVSWEAEDRASLKLAASARVWPLLVVVDSLWFALRHVRWRKPAVNPTPAPG